MKTLLSLALFLASQNAHAFFPGSEIAGIIELVTGQIKEIEKISETLGIAKDQIKLLRDLNEGTQRAVQQITALQSIVDRASLSDPQELHSLASLNRLLDRTLSLQKDLDEAAQLTLSLSDGAIDRGAEQAETSFKVGQEMVAVGTGLATESQMASPGRAAQISAAANSAQMLSQGIELQSLAQIIQLQSLQLELAKQERAETLRARKIESAPMVARLKRPSSYRSTRGRTMP